MIADVSTMLECPATKAWSQVETSALLRHVTRPLVRFAPSAAPLPERWSEGLTLQWKVFVFGVIPMGVHTVHLEKVDPNNYEIHSREHNRLIARWDHVISIKPLDNSRSFYRDTVEIDAGILTFVVWAWANWLYRHRQRRWRALAKTL
jgi:hypothetical protein